MADYIAMVFIFFLSPMGWLYTLKCFWYFSDILTDNFTALVDTSISITTYRSIVNILNTGTFLCHTLDSLAHIDFYMNYIIISVKGDSEFQHKFLYGNVQALKFLFTLLMG